jgi:hypothetical protein
VISDAPEELPQFVELTLGQSSLDYKKGETVWHMHAEWIVEAVDPKCRLILKRRDP